MPASLPDHLMSYQNAQDEDSLLTHLIIKPTDLVSFFAVAAEDETWSEKHIVFMSRVLDWYTNQFIQERVSFKMAGILKKAVQEHWGILGSILPKNIDLSNEEKKIAVNGMFLALESPVLHEVIRTKCRDGIDVTIIKKEFSNKFLSVMEQFVHSGKVLDLWKNNVDELHDFLKQSQNLEIKRLSKLCQETMMRYINQDNLLEWFHFSRNNKFNLLFDYCCHILSQRTGIKCARLEDQLGIRLESSKKYLFSLEFFEFTEKAKDLFENLAPYITQLVFAGSFSEDPYFSVALKKSTSLSSVDISRSIRYHERLQDLPKDLQELDVSLCGWMTDINLKKITQICPLLQSLNLASDVELTYRGWGELQKFKRLSALNLARCHQLRDSDFKIILNASPDLILLNCEDCIHLSDRILIEMARNLTKLRILNLSKCQVSDGVLMEIASQCKELSILNIMHCSSYSTKGLYKIKHYLPSLKKIIK